jgi:hypothetical protein
MTKKISEKKIMYAVKNDWYINATVVPKRSQLTPKVAEHSC